MVPNVVRRAGIRAALCLSILGCFAAPAAAADEVTVREAWIRATVPGQPVAGAFMTLVSASDAALIGARSPVAKSCEVHEMKTVDGVMKMRAIPSLRLPAGQAVALEPGGLHLMLFGIRAPLKAGTTVPVTLVFKRGKGKSFTQTVEVPVRPREG